MCKAPFVLKGFSYTKKHVLLESALVQLGTGHRTVVLRMRLVTTCEPLNKDQMCKR